MKRTGLKILNKMTITFFVLTLVLAFASFLNAQSPMINYQGKVTDSDGVPLNGTYSLQFKIYNQETGGTALWTETQSSVVVENGIFNVLLGSTNPIPSNLFNGDERWLGVKVGTDPEMSPRQQIVSVGYALRSDKANEADDSDKLDNHDSNYFATADHNHDSEYVNEGQENSIDSTMILDSSISKNDCFFSIPDCHSLDASDGDPEDVVYVDNDGNVGIGGLDPYYKFTLVGNFVVGDNRDGSYVGYVANGNTGSQSHGLMVHTESSSNSALAFNVHTTGTNTSRLAVTGAGNVGIGTTNPSEKLDVNGAVNATTYYGDGSNLTGIGGEGFGSWVSRTIGTIYQAATDGFVTAYSVSSRGNIDVQGITDSSPSPSTVVIRHYANYEGSGTGHADVSFPVKKDDYYKVTISGDVSTGTMYFLPFGN